ncbi:MAG: LicD family protein [Clostridia bacterium]|nr:LicD family protein [Clostridia bacterium]
MKEIDSEELKRIELDLLSAVAEICRQQGFKYALYAGTLIGAVRHQGFIPWDDDVDIVLTRPDYDAFIDYCMNNEVPFKLVCSQTEPNYGYLFAKVCAKNTSITDNVIDIDGVDLGVYIDLWPLDGLGDTPKKAVKKYRSTLFKRELLVAANWKGFHRSKTRPWYVEPVRLAFYIMSRFSSRRKLVASLEKKLRKTPYDTTEYDGIIMGSYLQKEIFQKGEVLDEVIPAAFEGREFFIPANYDSILTQVYGDYMQLPPESKQVSRHSFTAYYTDTEASEEPAEPSGD